MTTGIRIALVGDFDPKVTAHRAIPEAMRLSSQRRRFQASAEWIPTTAVGSTAEVLRDFAAVWCVPASPYASMDGALSAIRYSRQSSRPFLGTCGGFQHAVLEFARNVLRHPEADHAETAPDSAMPVIARLTCSLVEKSGSVLLADGSRLRAIYGAAEVTEEYHCNYGFNPVFERLLTGPDGLRIAARDSVGEIRAIELSEHPFFIATLFQPERSALRGVVHPLISAFLEAAARYSNSDGTLTPLQFYRFGPE